MDVFENDQNDRMAEYERMLCEHNDDDWFIPDCCLEIIGVKEYRMYEAECKEGLVEDGD